MSIRLPIFITTASLLLVPLCGLAADSKPDLTPPKDTRTEAQKNFDRNLKNANEVSARQQQEKTRETMRDKTHDNRVKTGANTSVGVDPTTNSVNVRKSTP